LLFYFIFLLNCFAEQVARSASLLCDLRGDFENNIFN
jgi:hypothetical protein